jgi:hypothetical protein
MTSAELYAILAGIFIGFVTIAVLVAIVIKQRQTIKDYENPKYGFLGKKLSAYLLGVTALGVAGILLFPNNIPTLDDSISVSDDVYVLTVDITAEQLNDSNQYLIRLLPSFDGVVWGLEDKYFAVNWLVNNDEYFEIIGFDNQGGIIVTLNEGINTIRGTIGLLENTITKEITVEVE